MPRLLARLYRWLLYHGYGDDGDVRMSGGYEYAARWEQYDGGWWPEHRGNFNSAEEARQWPERARDVFGRQVRNIRVWRRPVGEWEDVSQATTGQPGGADGGH